MTLIFLAFIFSFYFLTFTFQKFNLHTNKLKSKLQSIVFKEFKEKTTNNIIIKHSKPKKKKFLFTYCLNKKKHQEHYTLIPENQNIKL